MVADENTWRRAIKYGQEADRAFRRRCIAMNINPYPVSDALATMAERDGQHAQANGASGLLAPVTRAGLGR